MAGGRSVKTRELHRNVRAMDKAVVGMERVKHAYIQTKESAEGGQAREKTTPIKYAEDQALEGMEGTARESIYQIRKQGERIVDAVRRIQRISSKQKQAAPFYQPKKQAERMAKTQAQRQAAVKRIKEQRAIKVRETSKQTIKTLDQGGRTVKSLKTKSIKTVEQTSHKAVKTTEQAAKSAQAAVIPVR